MLRKLPLVAAVLILVLQGGALAKNANLTGKCVCRVGNNPTIYSETECVKISHDDCTAVKVACVNANAAACTAAGGTISQSTARCTGYDKKC